MADQWACPDCSATTDDRYPVLVWRAEVGRFAWYSVECDNCGHRGRIKQTEALAWHSFLNDEVPSDSREIDRLRAENERLRAVAAQVLTHYSASLDYQPPYVRIAREALEATDDS